MVPEIRHYRDLSGLSHDAARFVLELAGESVRQRGVFSVVLSGGTTPRLLYQELARLSPAAGTSWDQVHFFWGDERCVPPDHPASNYAMARQALIAAIPVPSANVHRIPAEIKPAAAAAEAYEAMLRQFFQPTPHSQPPRFPRFDLVLLGLGSDGHTASLFPGDQVLEERERWVVPVEAPGTSPAVSRVTLTLPVFNRARCVLFLVSRAGKEDVLSKILGEVESEGRLYPAARVQPEDRLLWFIDEGVA
jgi:6-phosphogluconolactonase